MKILALDPGGTTGYALFDTLRQPILSRRTIQSVGQCEDHMIWDLLSNIKPHFLVVERFDQRGKLKVDFTPVEVIGVVKEWARQNAVGIQWQTSSEGKFYFTDDRLKELGVYKPSMKHAMDATRHLFHYLEFKRGKRA